MYRDSEHAPEKFVMLNDMKTYPGGCHCGKIRFEADFDQLESALSCNCSLCSKRGALLAFVPAAQLRLIQGDNELTDYQFNKKLIHHTFCKVCGVASFGRGSDGKGNEMVAINVRCLDDVDIESLKINHYNGKDA